MIISIGLDREMVARIRAAISQQHIIAYDNIPDMYSMNGKLYVESPNIMGKFLKVDFVLWYGYFPEKNSVSAMKTIALSDALSFPSVRSTIVHEDRALSLIKCRKADDSLPLPRGWIPPNTQVEIEPGTVAKFGNIHCGENKVRIDEPTMRAFDEGAIVEPFISGKSRRILIVGQKAWQIDYESDDWRKNVNAKTTVTKLFGGHMQDNVDPWLVLRATNMASKLSLHIVGADYIGERGHWQLLEANAYPGLEDIPEAQEEFVRIAATNINFWSGEKEPPDDVA